MLLFMLLSTSLSDYPNTRGSSRNPLVPLFNKQNSFPRLSALPQSGIVSCCAVEHTVKWLKCPSLLNSSKTNRFFGVCMFFSFYIWISSGCCLICYPGDFFDMQINSQGHTALVLSSTIALFSLIFQLAKFQRCLILWLADTSHNLIPSIGPFHGSITNSEIRTLSALRTNTLCVFMSSPCRWCCQARNVSEVFAWIKVSSTINLEWRLREPYKQQDRGLSLTGRRSVPKQTHTHI